VVPKVETYYERRSEGGREMMMTLWNVEVRHLAICAKDRHVFGIQVATKSSLEHAAVGMVRGLYTEEWWKENIIQDVKEIGRLRAAEDLQVPQEELD
jgi:hypothetical protein